jgi:hypothetical protein
MADWITETIVTTKLILLYGWPFLLLIYIGIRKLMLKNWPVEAVIIEKRGENLIKTNDRAGRYVDKYTGITGYKLQKAKDTIPILNYDWVLHNMFKPTTIGERITSMLRGNIGTIFLFRYGSKQYKPIRIVENGKSIVKMQEIKDKSGQSVYVNIYQPIDPRKKFGSLDFEVIDWDNMNFMVQEQRASIERRKKASEFWKQIAIPIAMLAITAVVCIILVKFAYDYSVSFKSSPSPSSPATSPATSTNIPIISDIVPQG